MPIVRNVAAVILGLVVGSTVNMGLLAVGGQIVPPPEGADTSTMEGLKETMHLFEAKHFVFPFLAHALGTLAGAVLAALVAATRKATFAMVIGIAFLIGGVINVAILPAPLWFDVLDLVVAYLPMGWLGGRIAGGGAASGTN